MTDGGSGTSAIQAAGIGLAFAVVSLAVAPVFISIARQALAAGRPGLLPVLRNHRGRELPVVLGSLMVLALATLAAADLVRPSPPVPRSWSATLLVGMLAVFAAGYADDLQPERIRGLWTHLRLLRRGRVTTGIWKLIAAVAAAAAWALVTEASPARVALGIPVIAGMANLWNLLDVAPGRALKAGVLAGVGLCVAGPSSLAALCAGTSAGLLGPDVRERSALGDGGANVLGFALGVLLFDQLAARGLAIALSLILALHVLAETVTLSRLIRALAPLRWLDDLGRIPIGEPEG